MATIQIEAKDLQPGDIVQMNAQCAWRVEKVLPGTDKVIEYTYSLTQHFGKNAAQLAELNTEHGQYKHRRTTKIKVHRG